MQTYKIKIKSVTIYYMLNEYLQTQFQGHLQYIFHEHAVFFSDVLRRLHTIATVSSLLPCQRPLSSSDLQIEGTILG